VRKFSLLAFPESFTPVPRAAGGRSGGLGNCWVRRDELAGNSLWPRYRQDAAHWIVDGRCPVDHTAFNVEPICRWQKKAAPPKTKKTRLPSAGPGQPELLAKSLAHISPNDQLKTARGRSVRRSMTAQGRRGVF